MKRSRLGTLLIALGLILFALSGLSWSRHRIAPEPEPETAAPAETAAVSSEPAEEATPEPTPVPTPEPTPVPTPTPTTRPLREPWLVDFRIDDVFFDESAEKGTLVKDVAYMTRDYVDGRDGDVQKLMQVYLPHGYEESGRYDVLFLLHVRSQDERFWLERPHEYIVPGEGQLMLDAVTLLDRLIELGYCKPMIVVSLSGYLDWESMERHRSEQVYPQFAREFREDILPFVAGHYATWAEDGSEAALQTARRHFAVLGASFGAFEAELSVLGPNLDLVSWYAMTGGGSVTREYLYPEWQQRGTLDEPIDLLYFGEGEYDDIGPVEGSYNALASWAEVFTRDRNLRFTSMTAAGHEQREWVNTLYNAVQLFFR